MFAYVPVVTKQHNLVLGKMWQYSASGIALALCHVYWHLQVPTDSSPREGKYAPSIMQHCTRGWAPSPFHITNHKQIEVIIN